MQFIFEKIPKPSSVSSKDWTCWKWQMRNSLKSPAEFSSFFSLAEDEKKALEKGRRLFAVKTTPYYAKLCEKHKALRKMTLPSLKETDPKEYGMKDPLGEENHSPLKRIVHRYPDRVLFLITDFCAIYCRYCTRKHFTAKGHSLSKKNDYHSALKYIEKNKGIREVILSGGDPLTLSDEKINSILRDLRAISHIEIIRIGSRMPAVCPFRITPQLISILKSYQPVYIMTHLNHPKEITKECRTALLQLADAGICVYNQMVFLSGVNNHPALVQALHRRLLYLRVRPYSIFQCDPSIGTGHFRTTLKNSKWIQKELWGVLSGLALPRIALDLPGGGGKVELAYNPFIETKGRTHFYEGFDGMKLGYEDPPAHTPPPQPEDLKDYITEWKILKNQPYGKENYL